MVQSLFVLGGMPATSATSLYADLLDNNGKVIQHRSMPVLSGSTDNFLHCRILFRKQFFIRVRTARRSG